MRRRSRSAFTLVELLVVIGIIGVLMGILLPAMSSARTASRELRSMSGLRQIMLGYTLYHQDNKDWVLWGYSPNVVNGKTVIVSDPYSNRDFGAPVSNRYPWRLVPYVSGIWEIIHAHDVVPPLPQRSDSTSEAFSKAYTLSLNPTYGINSVYVGGDTNYSGFDGGRPSIGKHVVFKASEVNRPTELIVFADSRTRNVASLNNQGMHFLTPPRAHGLNWTVVKEVATPSNKAQIMGVPSGWYSKRVIVSFFDTHVESRLPDELEDMRLWANDATTPDYDYSN